MTLIRWQNLLFALLPGWDAAALAWAPGAAGTRARCREPCLGRDLSGCLVLAFLPQMLAWRSIYGSLIARSPIGPEIRWLHPHVVDVLWSARNGLFSTSPILYAADRSRGLRDRTTRRGPASPARRVRHDLLQWLYPGLVGQRRIWGAEIRRHNPAALSGVRNVRRVRRRDRTAPRARSSLRRRNAVRRLEPRADGGSQNNMFRLGRRCRSTGHGAIRRRSSTAGSAIRSATRRASPSRCETAFRLVPTISSTNRFLGDPLGCTGESTSGATTTG